MSGADGGELAPSPALIANWVLHSAVYSSCDEQDGSNTNLLYDIFSLTNPNVKLVGFFLLTAIERVIRPKLSW